LLLEYNAADSDVSVQYITSIFMVEERAKQERSCTWYLLHAGFLHLAYSSTLKMEAMCSS
jgi:hypothetical protein